MIKKQLLRKIISQPIQEDDNCETYSLHFSDDGKSKKLPYVHETIYENVRTTYDAYNTYLNKQNFVELSGINRETTNELYLVLEDGFRQRRIVLEVVHDSYWEPLSGLDDFPMDECCPKCGGKGKDSVGMSSFRCTECYGSGFKDHTKALHQKQHSPFEIYVMDMQLKQIIHDKYNESND